jgi:hypothetical protein
MPVTHDPVALLSILLVATMAGFGWRLGNWIAGKILK